MPPSLNYDSPAFLRRFLEERGLGMRKKFGQNFLVSPGARRMLLDALETGEGEEVWEVGPGLGAMTAGLLDRGARVRAFEIDPAFSRLLRELFAPRPGFTLVEGDVLKTWRAAPPAPRLLGNLPYNIAAALLSDFIEGDRLFDRMVVTVQREVARRMAAGPGSPDYSSFSVLCASAYTVTPLRVIKGAAFYPVPRVDSQGLRLDRRHPAAVPPPLFRPLLRRLFADRRKTLKNNLQGFIRGEGLIPRRTCGPRSAAVIKGLNPSPTPQENNIPRGSAPGLLISGRFLPHNSDIREIVAAALESSGIDGMRRAETLSLEEFFALARSLGELAKGNGYQREGPPGP